MYIDLMSAEEFGGLFFTELEVEILVCDYEENTSLAIKKGRLLTEIGIREQVIKLAKEGDADSLKLIEKWKMKIAIEDAR